MHRLKVSITRHIPVLLISVMLGSQLAWAGTLWRRDGLPNVAGTWLFHVGARKHVYRVYLRQTGQMLGGYMVSPAGKRFDFIECGSRNDDCSYLEGSGTSWWLHLREGESRWSAQLGRGGGTWGFEQNRGSVTHIYSGGEQAIFSGRKL